MARNNGAIDPRILDEAAEWLMRLNATTVTAAERAACERWRQRSPDHARAWARAELLMHKLVSVPAPLAMPALDRRARPCRRAAVARLAALLAVAPAAWLGWRLAEEQGWTAEQRTASGERRDLHLADGSRVTLNTASSIDVRFSTAERYLVLRRGEILIQTAPDTATPARPLPRPFRVGTAEGRLEALGTRFSVRRGEGRTLLAVLEGAVRMEPGRGGTPMHRVVRAGEQAVFTALGVESVSPADEAATAWVRGMLVADRMPLAELVAELARYRRGIVRCDPAVAHLPISGTFPIGTPERVLAMLVSTYPIEVRISLGGYWVSLGPR